MDPINFKSLLDEQINWPDFYVFKFITKTDKKHHVINELSGHKIQQKASKNGKYTSITSRKLLNSSDEVLEIYSKINKIEGVIKL